MRYFSSFPQITYDKQRVIDVTRRVKIIDKSKKSPYAFYPYDITNHLRSDQIAEYYYEDPFLDWLIYVSNDIVDPYYDWYVSDEQFDLLIKEKYGSVETAQKKIKYFMNNWFEHADEYLTTTVYDNVITGSHRKYYDPVFSENGKVMFYARRRVDHTMNTNKIVDFGLTTYTTGNTFTQGEVVDIWMPGTQIATGEIVFSNSSLVRVQSVIGNTTANSTSNTYLVGETSSTNATANSSNTVVLNIPDDEYVFWSPVTFYDDEKIKNEAKKTIKLVDSSVKPFLVSEFSRKIANT